VTAYCQVGDCVNPAERGTLCATHRKRLARGTPAGPVRPRNANPWSRLADAALDLMLAQDTAARAQAMSRARYAARVLGRRRANGG
jgi:hypothetical protein